MHFLQARIDFDEDLPAMDAEVLQERLWALVGKVQAALNTSQHSRLLSNGLQMLGHVCIQTCMGVRKQMRLRGLSTSGSFTSYMLAILEMQAAAALSV